jgi:UDP-N-acetylmuramyl tripeptide synthase
MVRRTTDLVAAPSARTRRDPVRARVAARATVAVNAVSRRFGLGSGTVIGGRVGLGVDHDLVRRLSAGRRVVLVSGTNGKTTTTRLLATALEGLGPVASNDTGANMPAGHAAALSTRRRAPLAVLEVDEGYVGQALEETAPEVVVLLNLSRDQLDRTNEVRATASRWREAFAAHSPRTVVANADDPLVVWGASSAPAVVWVAAGLRWTADASGCPSCEGHITFDADGWRCTCGFVRPRPDVVLDPGDDASTATFGDGRAVAVAPGMPGRFNRANALMAAVAAEAMGVELADALAAMAGLREVAGRFSVRTVDGVPTRLLLAKNPAGWSELLELVAGDGANLVVGINARVADGRDPSWLWDVPFERLRGRAVIATGERFRDLSVRLHYAEVAHEVEPDPMLALRRARDDAGPGGTVDLIGNYTAFHDVLQRA